MSFTGKHRRNRFVQYWDTHLRVMAQFTKDGFVLHDGLVLQPFGKGHLLLEGRVECYGGLIVTVSKRLAILSGGKNPWVENVHYSYNVSLRNERTIFRYNSPHKTHNQFHHVHRANDPFGEDRTETVHPLPTEDDIPTLGQVLEEAKNWFWNNSEMLQW